AILRGPMVTKYLQMFITQAIGQDWVEVQKVTSDEPVEGMGLAADVHLDGDTMILGANGDDRIALNQGSASIYVRRNRTWEFDAELRADDGMPEDHFGISVSVNGDRAVVGAARGEGASADSGAAYVFEFGTGGWSQTAKLFAPEGVSGDVLGLSVALQGDTIVVGAPGEDSNGAAHVFAYDGANWQHAQKLTASDATESDAFGAAVALNGNTLVVGAPQAGADGDEAGACYVFEFDGSQWVEAQKLRPTTIDDRDEFGLSIAIDTDTILAGAPEFDDGSIGIVQPGAAFVYTRVDGVWIEQAMLMADDANTNRFGSVAIEGNTAVIGAQWDEQFGRQAGAAFVFKRSGVEWPKAAKLVASDAGTNQLFGHNTAIDNGTIACASSWAPVDGVLRAGAAYIFEPNPCPADLDGDGELTIFDFLAFQNAFDAMEPVADFDGDGDFTLFDFLAFQNAFDLGCP
ncbi:MAG: GC-type dockerin domain-anchored protein, partial [Phycisphaerales bacterium JB064]